uniref:Cell division cycle protein 23 n=1 Tax=Arundo donax TaxID=35708 RepID=A0A0A9C0T0_ARUDO
MTHSIQGRQVPARQDLLRFQRVQARC